LASFLNGKKQKVQFVFWMGLFALIFPFSGTPSSIHWQEFYLSSKQEQIRKLKVNPSFLGKKRISTAYPYVYYELEVDCFDSTSAFPLSSNLENLRSGDMLIWDSDFATIENGVSKEILMTNSKLEIVFKQSETLENKDFEIVVFRCK